MDIEEDRSIQSSHLHKNERKFLAGSPHSDDLDSEKKNKARRKIIDERLPSLPQRIQALVDDIALLDAGGFLDSEYGSEEWEELLNIEPQTHLKRDPEFVESSTWIPNTKFANEVRLGYTIGHMLRSLTYLTDTNISYDELGWGFTLGLLGEPRSNFGRECDRVSSFLDYIQEKFESREEYATEIEEIMEMGSIEEDLSQNPVDGDPILGSNIGMMERNNRARRAVKKLQRVAHRDETTDPDIEYLRLLEDILTDPEEVVGAMELINQIQDSIKLINNSQSGQLFAKEVFQVVWNTDSINVRRNEIKGECNASKKQVTEIMNNFGSNSSSDKWINEPPLVKREGNNRVGKKWSLTNLGYVVGYAMFEENGGEFVNRAIGQVITHKPDQHEIHNRIFDAIFEI